MKRKRNVKQPPRFPFKAFFIAWILELLILGSIAYYNGTSFTNLLLGLVLLTVGWWTGSVAYFLMLTSLHQKK